MKVDVAEFRLKSYADDIVLTVPRNYNMPLNILKNLDPHQVIKLIGKNPNTIANF